MGVHIMTEGRKRPALGVPVDTQLLAALASAVLYFFCSSSMTFVNKATLREFGFPNTLLFLQMLAGITIVLPLKEARLVSFPALCPRKARTLLPVTLLYTANVGFGLLGLSAVSIPVYTSLKRLTPVVLLVVKSCATRTLPPWQVSGSVALLVGGCVIAGIGDLAFDLAGYCCALTSCLLQAGYLLLVERSGAEKGTGTTELLLYNSLLSLPFIAMMMLATGEAGKAWPAFVEGANQLGVSAMAALVACCSVAGLLLNFSLFWCTHLNSALTTTIVGVMKGVAATVLGFFVLGGVHFHPLNVAGIAMNAGGGVWYTVIKYHNRVARSAPHVPRDKAGANAAPVPATRAGC